MFRLLIIILISWSICCCTSSIRNHSLQLSNAQLTELLLLINSHDDSTLNYHMLYSEHFNDSTVVVKISHNQYLASQELGVCEMFTFKKSNVFIYSSNPCQSNIPESLKSKSVHQQPFYIPDSPVWTVLVKKQNGQIMYSEIRLFEDYSQKDKPDFEGSPL